MKYREFFLSGQVQMTQQERLQNEFLSSKTVLSCSQYRAFAHAEDASRFPSRCSKVVQAVSAPRREKLHPGPAIGKPRVALPSEVFNVIQLPPLLRQVNSEWLLEEIEIVFLAWVARNQRNNSIFFVSVYSPA